MKNKQSLIVFIFLCASYFGFGQSDVIISQYIETNSGTTPKGIEIFNISDSDIDFSTSALQVYQGTNGGACSNVSGAAVSSGILKANEVWVIGTSDLTIYANTNGTALSGITTFAFLFNGDDALQLYLGGVLQDQFGICGSDPESAWSGSGVSTANQNIQVLDGLCDGDTDGWTDPSTRFSTISTTPVSDMSGFGNAPASCNCVPPSDPSGTISSTQNCGSTDLSFSVNSSNLYWQTTATGTSTANPTTSSYNVTSTGTYYVRAYNGSCWSTNSVSYGVTINTPISISGQPDDDYVLVSEAATFIVSVTGTPTLSFQWQVSTDGGTIWNNVIGGTGANTAAFTTDAAVLSMDGELYRCVVTNTCGSVISNSTILNVSTLADVVITEIMYNTSGFDDEWIEICNLSGSSQKLSNHKIDIGGVVVFTFPGGTSISDGTCITVSLGSNGDGTYNNGNGTLGFCPFTPDFGISAGTNNNGNLNNSTEKISLLAPNGSTEADAVTYHSSDGGDGNGSSLHVIDSSQDNSDTGTNWQEVDYGGSSKLNTLLPNCLPAGVDINVEGNLNNFPDISDGDNTPSFFDNTAFSSQFIGNSQAKSYRIQNLSGSNLTISNITITGHDSDFSISIMPSSTITYLNPSILEITFSPTQPGLREAVVHIFNNDPDTESEYTFAIEGNGLCVASSNTITPSSGPEGTIVTVSGSNLNTATAKFNGVPSVSINHISASLIEVTVPSGATTGNLEILDSTGCTSVIPFTVIENKISSCEGGSALSELFISEVTDATYGGLSYIELYNPTNISIDLSNYAIEIFINGNTDSSDTGKYKIQALNGTILAGNTFVVSTGYSGSFNCDSQPGGDSSYSDFNSTTLGGINKEANKHDYIGLLNTGVLIDEFGVFGVPDWMDTLHTTVSGDRGFNFRRLNTATSFSDPFDDNDWNIIDWVGTGSVSCTTNDYSNVGIYDFSSGKPPVVASGPTINSSCNTATISVSGSEGSLGGNPLAYQWYYSAPGDAGWTAITNGGFYDDATTATLDILDTSSLEGLQYYCQIREDDANCYSASNAVQLTLPTTTWDGTSWSSPPTIDKIAIIDGDYDTAFSGSFNACSLIINSGNELNVRDNTYVKVQNNVVVNGILIVQTKGAFVQIDINGTFTLNPSGISRLIKETANIENWYEYTYWSSPVKNQTIQNAFPDTPITRRFWFNAKNYLDSTKNVGNNNTSPGQDDIDDSAPWDWEIASGGTIMIAGLGYAATSSQLGFFPKTDQATFEGAFNNGIVTIDIFRNDSEPNDNNWNLIGNPYPGAISADSFLLNNLAIQKDVSYKPAKSGFIEGAIFFWSQNSAPSASNNGNQNKNFSQNDYAIISMSSEIAGGDGVKPNRFIPSGQGFFIAYYDSAPGTEIIPGSPIKKGTVTFTNSMRMADETSNSQFFRTSKGNTTKSKDFDNKLWVNLTSDNGVFNQLAVGYVDYATNGYDGMAYDTPRNLSSELYSNIYTLIPNIDKKFAIQGKDPNSLGLEEVIPIGFNTWIDVPTLYTLSIPQVEGEFLTSNTIYLKDNLMQKVHDLTASDYSFTSEVGEFKDRFEIVFQPEALSDVEAQLNINKLTIIELNDGRVQMKTNTNLTIKSVQILDMLGRMLYQLKGTNTTEIYNLNNLSQSAFIAKVELSNGQIIAKKAIKRN